MEKPNELVDVPADADGAHRYYDVWYNNETPGTVALNGEFIHFKSHTGAHLKLFWENVGKCHLHNPPVILSATPRGSENTASFEIRDCRNIEELKRQLDECMTPDPDGSEKEGVVTRRERELDPHRAGHGDDYGGPRKKLKKDPIEDPKQRKPSNAGPWDLDPDCLLCWIIVLIILIILVVGLILIFEFVVYDDDDDKNDDDLSEELRNSVVGSDIDQEGDGLFIASNNSALNRSFPF